MSRLWMWRGNGPLIYPFSLAKTLSVTNSSCSRLHNRLRCRRFGVRDLLTSSTYILSRSWPLCLLTPASLLMSDASPRDVGSGHDLVYNRFSGGDTVNHCYVCSAVIQNSTWIGKIMVQICCRYLVMHAIFCLTVLVRAKDVARYHCVSMQQTVLSVLMDT